MKIGSTEYDVIGFDEYIKDFEEKAIPEFKNDAESLLQDELEKSMEDGVCRFFIWLYEDKTKENQSLIFDFSIEGENREYVTYDGFHS